MAKSLSSSSSFHKILILVFGIAFGLVALALVYQGTRTSTDIRSRAALEEKIVQGWEFNGETTENWTGVNINSLTLKPIVLPNKVLVFGVLGIGKPGEIRNDTVKTIPVGFKKIKFRLLASSMTKKSYPFTMKIVLSNKTKGDVFTGSMSGIADN